MSSKFHQNQAKRRESIAKQALNETSYFHGSIERFWSLLSNISNSIWWVGAEGENICNEFFISKKPKFPQDFYEPLLSVQSQTLILQQCLHILKRTIRCPATVCEPRIPSYLCGIQFDVTSDENNMQYHSSCSTIIHRKTWICKMYLLQMTTDVVFIFLVRPYAKFYLCFEKT